MFCNLCLNDHMRDESCEQAARPYQYTPDTCPGRPCGSGCDHRGAPPTRQYRYYTLEAGRVISLGGDPVCTVGHIRGRSPADTDDLAHRIVWALNLLGPYSVSDT